MQSPYAHRRRPEPARPVGDAPARLRLPGRRSLMPRAVVTGGAGFLGSHLCRALHARGWEVVAVDDLSTGFVANVEDLLDRPNFEFVEHDVIYGLPIDGPVSAVLHLASAASPPAYLGRPIATLEVGSIGTQHALELARKHDGARVLLASTSEVYGDPDAEPPARELLGKREPGGPAVGLRRGEALRRSDDDGVSPAVRNRHEDRPHLQHVRPLPATGRRPRRSRTSSPRRSTVARSRCTATVPRRGRSATSTI